MRLIFSDIDGTLLNSDHRVSPLTKNGIQKLDRQGIPFVLVSARMPEAIQKIMDSIGINGPIISYNGGLIQDITGQTIFSKTIPITDAIAVANYIERNFPEIAWNIYSFHNWFAQLKESPWVTREEKIVGLQSERIKLEEVDVVVTEAHKILLMGEEETIAKLAPLLIDNFPKLSIVQSNAFLLEVMPKGIDKGQAIRTLAEFLEVPLTETIGFGDNFNDLEMLKTVGLPVIMGNAPQVIQNQFEFITSDNDHDGILKAIKKIGLITNEL